MCEHLQEGDLPDSKYGMLKLLQEGAWGGCYELVEQGFVHIMLQLESPSIFSVETDGIVNFFRGVYATMNWRSFRVYGDSKSCGGCGGSILGSGHHNIKVNIQSSTKWHEDGCRVDVEISKGGQDALEGGFLGSVRDGCQGFEREVLYGGVGGGHSGNNKDAVIGSELGSFGVGIYEPHVRLGKYIIHIC